MTFYGVIKWYKKDGGAAGLLGRLQRYMWDPPLRGVAGLMRAMM
jgi:hypothetical protein